MWNDYFSVLCDHPADPMSGPLKCWVSAQRRNKKRLTAEEREALESIPGWVWKTRKIKNRYSWDEQLAALREYVAANNALPKKSHERLGLWINSQRMHKNKLTDDKKASLEAIPGWLWKAHEVEDNSSWDERLLDLIIYVGFHNKLPDHTNKQLSTWVMNQRRCKNKLTAEKQAALEAVPGWAWNMRKAENKCSWEENFNALRDYVSEHKALPTRNHTHLSTWVYNQRRRKNKLTPGKKAALEAVSGWKWKMHEIRNKYSWEEQLIALHDYVSEHGAMPKQCHTRLGAWISSQRQQYKKHKLSAAQINSLQSVPLWHW
jgi:hypothetical protein